MTDFVQPNWTELNCLLTPGEIHSRERRFSETLLKFKKKKGEEEEKNIAESMSSTESISRVTQFPNPKSNSNKFPTCGTQIPGQISESSQETKESIYASWL